MGILDKFNKVNMLTKDKYINTQNVLIVDEGISSQNNLYRKILNSFGSGSFLKRIFVLFKGKVLFSMIFPHQKLKSAVYIHNYRKEVFMPLVYLSKLPKNASKHRFFIMIKRPSIEGILNKFSK